MVQNETAHGVAIVVDPVFGEKLFGLAARLHVWILETPVNKVAAQAVWSEGANVHSLDRGATTFSGKPTDPPDEIVTSMLDTIDLHHGEYGHSPPLSVLEVYGAKPTTALSAALAERGFTNVSPMDDGFRAWRSVVEVG
jgi:hypothetical protein